MAPTPTQRQPASVAPILFGCVLALAFLHAASLPVSSNDLHIFMASGRWMLEHQALMQSEVFTWSAADQSFANPTWGFSVLSYWLHQRIGLEGLRLFNGAMVTGALLWTGIAIKSQGGSSRSVALGTLLAWILLLQNLSVRGQSWVFWLLPLCATLASQRRLWLQLLGGLAAGALWSNLHGSFPIAGVWLVLSGGALALQSRDWRAALPSLRVAGALALGSLLNPEGLGVWAYIWQNTSTPASRGFVEWLPPDLMHFEGLRFYGSLVLLLALVLLRRPHWSLALVVLPFALLAASGTRHVAWYGLSVALLWGRFEAKDQGGGQSTPAFPRLWVRGLGAALALLFSALAIIGLRGPVGLHPDTPVTLVEALRERCGQCQNERIFNPPEYGGYLSFELPGLKTSGDIRAWVFPDSAWERYPRLSQAPPGWSQELQEQGVTALLLWRPFHQDTLIAALPQHQEWRVLAQDEFGVLAVRSKSDTVHPPTDALQ